MSLGSGIFASTLLLVLVFAVWQATKHQKWRSIGKAVALLAAISVLLGLGSWGWYLYANRPQVQNELEGIALGATQLDVQLKKGKPSRELKPKDDAEGVRWIFFDNDDREDEFTFVLFSENASTRALGVSIVCRQASYLDLLGFSRYTDEASIIAKLGNPTHISIRADGLAKTISFEQWKVAFEFEREKMKSICISDSGKVRYSEEHAGKASGNEN
jgi:hypothetical protein